MSVTLTLRTGDATALNQPTRVITLTTGEGMVRFDFDGSAARIPTDGWSDLVNQVRIGDLTKRVFPDMLQPPLGNPDLLTVLNQISSTPSYQLFLAAVDLASILDIPSDDSPKVLRRFQSLHDWVPSVTGRGGLLFLPEPLFRGEESTISELESNNKVCYAKVNTKDDCAVRYYIPYATPIGFITPVSPAAIKLWESIRDYDSAYRQTA